MKLPKDYGPEDFLAWCNNPLTQCFFDDLQEDRQTILEAWGRRGYVGETTDQTLQLNAIGLAQIKTIDELLQNLESSKEEARKMIADNQKRK